MRRMESEGEIMGMENEITRFNMEEGMEELLALIKVADFVAIDATVETTGVLLQNEEFNSSVLENIDDPFGKWYDYIKDKEKESFLLEVGIAVFAKKPMPVTLTRMQEEIIFEVEAFNIPVIQGSVDGRNANPRGRGRGPPTEDGYDGRKFMKPVTFDFDVAKSLYMGAPYRNQNLSEAAADAHKDPEETEATQEERDRIIGKLRGISKIFEAIAESEVPVIGHNLLLKMIFIYKDFFQYLPDTYPEYKELMSKIFKLVYDTKQLAKDLRGSPKLPLQYRKSLTELKLYSLLRNTQIFQNDTEPLVVHIGGRSQSYGEDAFGILSGKHLENDCNNYCFVAGFDSLTSGLVFLNLVSVMHISNFKFQRDEGGASQCYIDTEDAQMLMYDYLQMFLQGQHSFKNKLYGDPSTVCSVDLDLSQELTEKIKLRRMKKQGKAEKDESI